MAGGTWKRQNKKQPGVYIDVKSQEKRTVNTGTRGVVAICEPLSWGPENQIMEIEAGEDFMPYIGYETRHEKALFLREIFKGSDRTQGPSKVLLCRPEASGASKASANVDSLTVSARYKGERGNDISFSVTVNPDVEQEFIVQTILDGTIRDAQTVKTIEELKANDWVEWSGTGSLSANVGTSLVNGANGAVDARAYADFLTKLELFSFNILIYDGTDNVVSLAYASFVKRMREEMGKKCQVVMPQVASDSECVISVKNGVLLDDGTHITAQQAVWWVGGAEAGASYNESLVYAQYPRAKDALPRLASAQIDEALSAGQIVFFEEFGSVKVVSDINTLVTMQSEKNEAFCLNQVIRTIDTVANDIYRYFSQNIIGKTQSNATGHDLLKAWIVGYLNEMQANGGIQNFAAEDVSVMAGEAINAVAVAVFMQPVTAIEKIYIDMTLTGI